MIYRVFQFMRSLRNWLIITLIAIFTVACSPAIPSQSSAPTTITQSPIAEVKPVGISRVVALTSLSADIVHRLDKTKLVGIPGSRLLRENAENSTKFRENHRSQA
jgi:iron complex transport system substrate-binding protein